VRAVDGVDFEVLKGETLGVVGESGCGKSTTARLLMQLMDPTKGELIFDGRTVGSRDLPLKEFRRQVQMVFQDSYASLNPRLTIEDSIAFGPQVHGVAQGGRGPRPPPAGPRGPGAGALPSATRTSSPAASASASTSPARWRCSRAW
jgi:ABC-type glutathione transport system ATPase component